MNRRYYGRIYLNRHLSPIDISLLDTKERLRNENKYKKEIVFLQDSTMVVRGSYDAAYIVADIKLNNALEYDNCMDVWLKIESDIIVTNGFNSSYLNSKLVSSDSIKHNRIRIFSPISAYGKVNKYAYYVHVPKYFSDSQLILYLSSESVFKGEVNKTQITLFR